MSRSFAFVSSLMVSLTFFYGLYRLAESLPVVAAVVVGIVLYTLVMLVRDAREL